MMDCSNPRGEASRYPDSMSALTGAQLRPWFELLRQMLPNPGPGLVAAMEGGRCVPLVSSPDITTETSNALLDLAFRAAKGPAPLVDDHLFAHPLRRKGRLFAVVAIELRVAEGQQPVVQHLLDWAERWLQLLLEHGGGETPKDSGTVLALVEDLVTTSPLEAALIKLADSLALHFRCERVAVGKRSGGRFELETFSHGLQFDRRTQLAREFTAAMQDIGDGVTVWPDNRDDGNSALERLAEHTGDHALCGVPLGHVGVVILERRANDPFTTDDQVVLAAAGRLLGPVLAQKLATVMLRQNPVTAPARKLRKNLFKRGHWGFKAALLAPLAVALLLAVVPGTFRVHADASIEGRVQRAVVAPFDGFIAEATSRAGDTVAAGAVIARMEDRELLLELRRSESEEEKLDKEYRKALAAGDRSEGSIVQARLAQVQAETRLLREKLDRIQLRAPLAGIIISGDLSRDLGAPVERGDVLFEVAPLDEYRLVLHVEEADVAHVAPGQRGTLTLTALPSETFSFDIEQLSPVFREIEGRVLYRAEARIEGDTPVLRPGMEGVGKVEVGRRSIGYILFHRLIDWLRLKLWLWLP